MVIINKEKEVCRGLGTRLQGQEKSILDYVLAKSKLLSTVTEMITDENKQIGRKTYSDHKAILSKLNLVTAIEKQKKNRIITKYGYKNIGTN